MTDMQTQRAMSGQSGLTLIETIIALALLAMLTALLTTSVNGSRRVLAMVERNDASNAMAAAQSYLRSMLTQSRQVQKTGDAAPSDAGFLGGPDSLTLTTSYVPRGQIDGLYRIEIGLERSASRRSKIDVVVTQTLWRPVSREAADVAQPMRRSSLIPNVEAVSFSYFGVVDEGSPPEWTSEWSATDRLPLLVGIEVRFPKADPRVWHRMQVPLSLAEPPRPQ